MRIGEIVWLAHIEQKCRAKQGVTAEEVADIFGGTPRFSFVERGL